MANETLFDMQDIKAIRKSDAELAVVLIAFGFQITFTYPNIKKMDAEFAKLKKQWNAVREYRQKYNIEHKKQHEKEMVEKVKLVKEQTAFMKAAKKHACSDH